MKDNTLNDFNHVVAIGGGHGLGRVLSALSFLGSRLTGIVTTTDNGGSTGRLRNEQNTIAWGDLRHCLTQLAKASSKSSLVFDYRFKGQMELSGHSLGNLILLALDEICVRPLEAVDLIRRLLKVNTRLIPMSEQPTDLVAIQRSGQRIVGELNIDNMNELPTSLSLEPLVAVTQEACDAIKKAELIILGPGSFLTSIMPPLLLPQLAKALAQSQAEVILIDNLSREDSPMGNCSIQTKLDWCQQILGQQLIDKVLCHAALPFYKNNRYFYPLRCQQNKALHDKQALIAALGSIVTPPHTSEASKLTLRDPSAARAIP